MLFVQVVMLRVSLDMLCCAELAVVNLGQEGSPDASAFFEEEYQLDYLLATFKKPVVSVLHGITMGGGVGISVHTPIRIATENTGTDHVLS